MPPTDTAADGPGGITNSTLSDSTLSDRTLDSTVSNKTVPNALGTDVVPAAPQAQQTLHVAAAPYDTTMVDLLGPDPDPPSSPRPPPPPASSASTESVSPRRHKAFYQLTKLDAAEIARRLSMGVCTYCGDDGHARHMCAQGRLMRKVSKAQLDFRLRRSVCPICGDPAGDRHCKQTCPRRIHVQAILDAKQEAIRRKKAASSEAVQSESLESLESFPSTPSPFWDKGRPAMQRVEYETVELRLPKYILKGNVGRPVGPALKPFMSSRGQKSPWWRAPSNQTSSTRKAVFANQDLIDLNTIPPSGRPKAANVPPPNLLDMDVTEVVWGSADILPCARRTDSGADNSLVSETAATDGANDTDRTDKEVGGLLVDMMDVDDTEANTVDDLIVLDK